MNSSGDGPASALFTPLRLPGRWSLAELAGAGISSQMVAALPHAPDGDCVAWGIPFHVDRVVLLADHAVTVELEPTTARWLVFMHNTDRRPLRRTSTA